MEFKEAMRIWKRLCKKHARCADCPMYEKVDACPAEVWNAETDVDTILTKWAAEHPERTIADDFFEKHPKAKKGKDDYPIVCAVQCGYIDECPTDYSRLECETCWRRPLEEAHHE